MEHGSTEVHHTSCSRKDELPYLMLETRLNEVENLSIAGKSCIEEFNQSIRTDHTLNHDFCRPWTASESSDPPVFLTQQRETRSREKIVCTEIIGIKVKKSRDVFKHESFRSLKPVKLTSPKTKVWNNPVIRMDSFDRWQSMEYKSLTFPADFEPGDSLTVGSVALDVKGNRRRSSVVSAGFDLLAPNSALSLDQMVDSVSAFAPHSCHAMKERRSSKAECNTQTATSFGSPRARHPLHRPQPESVLELKGLAGVLDRRQWPDVSSAAAHRTAPDPAAAPAGRIALRPSALPYILLEFNGPTRTLQASLVNGASQAALWQHCLSDVQSFIEGAAPLSPSVAAPAPPAAPRAACARHLALLQMLPAGRRAAFLDSIKRAAPPPPPPPRWNFAAPTALEAGGASQRPGSLRSAGAPELRLPPVVTLQGAALAAAAAAAAAASSPGASRQIRRNSSRRGWRFAGPGGARRLWSRKRQRRTAAASPRSPRSVASDGPGQAKDGQRAAGTRSMEVAAATGGQAMANMPSTTTESRSLFLTDLLGHGPPAPPTAPQLAVAAGSSPGADRPLVSSLREESVLDAAVLQRLRAVFSTRGPGGMGGAGFGLSPTPPASPRPLRAALPPRLWEFPLGSSRRAAPAPVSAPNSVGSLESADSDLSAALAATAENLTGCDEKSTLASTAGGAAGASSDRWLVEVESTPRRAIKAVQLPPPEVLETLRVGRGCGGSLSARAFSTPRSVLARSAPAPPEAPSTSDVPVGGAATEAVEAASAAMAAELPPLARVSSTRSSRMRTAGAGLDKGGAGRGRQLRPKLPLLPLVTLREAPEAKGAASARTQAEWEVLRESFARRGWHGRRLRVEAGELEGAQATPPAASILAGPAVEADPCGSVNTRRGRRRRLLERVSDNATAEDFAVIGGRLAGPRGILALGR